MCVANITNILNERDCASRTMRTFSMEKNVRRERYQGFKMKVNACREHNALNERECALRTLHRF